MLTRKAALVRNLEENEDADYKSIGSKRTTAGKV